MLVSLLELLLQPFNLDLELLDYLNLRIDVLLWLVLNLSSPCRIVQGAYGFGEVFLRRGHTGNHQAIGIASQGML